MEVMVGTDPVGEGVVTSESVVTVVEVSKSLEVSELLVEAVMVSEVEVFSYPMMKSSVDIDSAVTAKPVLIPEDMVEDVLNSEA
jgi:hypothetical protein